MLVRFNVKNFLSFDKGEDGESIEFSMIAGRVKGKPEHVMEGKARLLKFAALYGANASGKSNVVRAFRYMSDTVLYGLPKSPRKYYCKINKDNSSLPTYFETEIKIDEHFYSYGFEAILEREEFVSEWLVDSETNRDIFTRDIAQGVFSLDGFQNNKSLKKRLELYAEDIKNDGSVLFLKNMNTNKKNFYDQFKEASVLRKIYRWFSENLIITYPGEPLSYLPYTSSEAIENVTNLLSAFGTGITKYSFQKVDDPKILSQIPARFLKDIESRIGDLKKKGYSLILRGRNNGINVIYIFSVDEEDEIEVKTISFEHGKNIYFDLREESDGTVRLLDLIEILLAGEGKTYVIDELDRCLHPNLTYRFVEEYLKIAAKKNIQLIVTAHESRLLDFELLRRDEIWFVDKGVDGASKLYSLEEYNERFDKKIDKAYLDGRYGGVPVFNTLFPIGDDSCENKDALEKENSHQY